MVKPSLSRPPWPGHQNAQTRPSEATFAVCLFVCLFVFLSACLYACLPVCLSACLSVCLSSVCLFVCYMGHILMQLNILASAASPPGSRRPRRDYWPSKLLEEALQENQLGFTAFWFTSPCSLSLSPQSCSKKLFKKTSLTSLPSVSRHLVAFHFEHVYVRVHTSIYIYI